MSGRKRSLRRREKRRALRKRLKSEGYTELAAERAVWRNQLRLDGMAKADIAVVLDDYVLKSFIARHGEELGRQLCGLDGYATPDDSKHKPIHVPAELRGVGRAIGQSAAAVRRGSTVTDWQHADSSSYPEETSGEATP